MPVTRDVRCFGRHSNSFDVKFEPIIKFVDVVIQVTPAEAELKVGGAKQSAR